MTETTEHAGLETISHRQILAADVTQLDKDILHLIIVGKSDRQIGEILGRSAKTINYHVERLKDRFGLSTRLQLVIYLVQQGHLKATVA